MHLKSKMLFGLLAIIIILFSGCVGIQTGMETPAMITPSINVYGKLIDYTQDGDMLTFKIQSEFVNYELNDSYLEMETKPEELYNFSDNYLRCINQKWYPTEAECKNHFYQQYNLSQKCRNITELLEKGLVYLKCDVKFDLERGNEYAFYFYKIQEKGPWTKATVFDNVTKYKEEGWYPHEKDLMYNFVRKSVPNDCKEEAGYTCAVQIVEKIFNPNESGKIQINLTNKQDNKISFDINAKVVDYYKLEPNTNYCPPQGYFTYPNGRREDCIPKTFEEKLKDAVIDSCSVSYSSNDYSIESKTSKILDFEVTCNEPLNCTEEPHYPNRTCSLVLYANVSWTDELGNHHTITNDYFVPTFYIE